MKLFFCDLETTGVRAYTHGVVQISGEIWTRMSTTGLVKQESFNLRAAPFEEDVIDLRALEVTGLTKAEIQEYPRPQDVFKDLKRILKRYVDPFNKMDKFFFLAYNAPFDENHLRAFFKKNSDPYFGSWFFWPSIDVAVLAADYLRYERKDMMRFKLSDVAERLGIEIESSRLHDALYDVELTRKIYWHLHQ